MRNSILLGILLISSITEIQCQGKNFSEFFNIDSCTFTSTGRNTYFILEPGFQLVLEGKDGKDSARVIITVLNETKMIGNVETRIVEENESINGEVIEISRNYFAICRETNAVFYFGEEVDNYKKGKLVNHSGAWIATGKNRPGLIMPGLPLVGSRYYQEIAPGIAMDRAEIISTTETSTTPAGKFINVLKTLETTPLEAADKSYKLYAPGIGLIQDEDLILVRYGYNR